MDQATKGHGDGLHEPGWSPDTSGVTLDLVASLAAIGRSLRGVFDPQRFLGEFSAQVKPLIPHDRLVMDHLDEDGRTFTVFAEHAPSPLVLHEEHYTTTFAPQARYVVAEWVIRSVFAGEPMLVQDFSADPRFASLNPFERKFLKAGLRSGLFVPLESGGKVIGAILATSLSPNTYGERHLSLLKEMALLIGPFIENIILLERERRRRRRLAALTGLARMLSNTLTIIDRFDLLANAVRPHMDFDIMGVSLLGANKREWEVIRRVSDGLESPLPGRIPVDHLSFAPRLQAGELVLIRDVRAELAQSSG